MLKMRITFVIALSAIVMAACQPVRPPAPGTVYPVIGLALPGMVGEIVGISADGQWWVAAVAAGPEGHGWVNTAYVEAANIEGVPVLPAPPLP